MTGPPAILFFSPTATIASSLFDLRLDPSRRPLRDGIRDEGTRFVSAAGTDHRKSMAVFRKMTKGCAWETRGRHFGRETDPGRF